MAQPTHERRRQCPTRCGGTHSLIAQAITVATCFERQRGNYHKCFSCEYRGLDSNAQLPAAPRARASDDDEAPRPVPAKPARKKAGKAP